MAGAVRYQIIAGDEISELGSFAYTDCTMQEITVANGSTNIQLDFGGVTTADSFFIESDQNLSLYFASGGTEIPLLANRSFFQAGTAITAIYVTNQSGSTANVKWKIWGDSGASTTPAVSDLSTALANTSNVALGDAMIGYKCPETGAVARTVHSRFTDFALSVIDFGADPTAATDSTAAIQAAIDAIEAAGGGTVYIPAGNYSITSLTIQSHGVCIQGDGRHSTKLTVTGSVDAITVGQDDVNLEYCAIRGIQIVGGRYALRLNNNQHSIYEDIITQTNTAGIYQEGQQETSTFRNMMILGSTDYGIITGQVNGGSDTEHNFPSIQKCIFEQIIIAGAGTAIYLTAGIHVTQRNNNHITFRHVLSQGTETCFINTDHTYNLLMEHCHNEIQGEFTDNTYTGWYFGSATQRVTLNMCNIATKSNGGNTFKYGLHQADGYMQILNTNMVGGATAGTADIYLAGIGANIQYSGVYGGTTSGIVFDNNLVKRQSILIGIFDNATNLPITDWATGVPYISSSTYPIGLSVGDILFEDVVRFTGNTSDDIMLRASELTTAGFPALEVLDGTRSDYVGIKARSLELRADLYTDPVNEAGYGQLYIDSADGLLKFINPTGAIKTITMS